MDDGIFSVVGIEKTICENTCILNFCKGTHVVIRFKVCFTHGTPTAKGSVLLDDFLKILLSYS